MPNDTFTFAVASDEQRAKYAQQGYFFEKEVNLGDEFGHTPEPRVRYIDRRDTRLFSKYAGCDALDFIRTVEPEPGRTHVLVLGMSASDYYGGNRNGDGFAEKPVYVNDKLELDWHETLPQHHKSFETHGHNFLHHANKDPRKAVGSIVQSFYNDVMHRVELLLSVKDALAGNFVRRIQDGEFPGVSMGCRIKYDICNVCGNHAPTRAYYCNHVNGQDFRYGLGNICPDGTSCIVWNPSPLLFDMSWVWKPADRIGFAMKKVASAPEKYGFQKQASGVYTVQTSNRLYTVNRETSKVASVQTLPEPTALPENAAYWKQADDKLSALGKLADIDKIVHGVIHPQSFPEFRPQPHDTAAVNTLQQCFRGRPAFGEELVDECAKHPLHVALGTLCAFELHPTVVEIYRIVCKKSGLPYSHKVAAMLPAMQSALIGFMQDTPVVMDSFLQSTKLAEWSNDNLSVRILEAALPVYEKRALYKEYLLRKYVPESSGGAPIAALMGADPTRAYYSPTQKVLEVADPASGKTYQTTQLAAEQSAWKDQQTSLLEAGILGAGTGIGYKVLNSLGKRPGGLGAIANVARFPVLGAGGYATYRAATQAVPEITTTSGMRIPFNTPLVEKRSGVLNTLSSAKKIVTDPIGGPLVGGALTTALVTSDLASDTLPPEARAFAKENPLLTFAGGTLGAGALRALLTRRATKLKKAHYTGYQVKNATQQLFLPEQFSLTDFCVRLAAAWADLV